VLLRSRDGRRAPVRNAASGKTRFSCGKPESVNRCGSRASQHRSGGRLHFLQRRAIFFLASRSRPGGPDDFVHPCGRSLALAVLVTRTATAMERPETIRARPADGACGPRPQQRRMRFLRFRLRSPAARRDCRRCRPGCCDRRFPGTGCRRPSMELLPDASD